MSYESNGKAVSVHLQRYPSSEPDSPAAGWIPLEYGMRGVPEGWGCASRHMPLRSPLPTLHTELWHPGHSDPNASPSLARATLPSQIRDSAAHRQRFEAPLQALLTASYWSWRAKWRLKAIHWR